MSDITQKNLMKMTGQSPGEMQYLLYGESMRGNAGKWNGYPCLVANFSFDPNNGEIMEFDNYTVASAEIYEATFRLALNIRLGKYRIVDINYNSVDISSSARETLQASLDLFNQLYGFGWNQLTHTRMTKNTKL